MKWVSSKNTSLQLISQKRIFFNQKKNPVPKNQSFNTRSYLTSKNSKRSMNTALPYNNNLNDENSKSKQKQTKKALINLQTIPSKQRKKKKHLEYLPKLI